MRVGHQRHLRRHHLHHQLHERVERIALYVELRRHHPLEFPHVAITDMTFIGARMYRDALRSESLYASCRLYHVGEITSARIAYYGNLVYIYTQFCHKTNNELRFTNGAETAAARLLLL